MKYVVILILIICFWFFLGTTMSYVVADPVLSDLSNNVSSNYSIETNATKYFNVTDDLNPVASAGGFFNMVDLMFGFRMANNVLPAGFLVFVKFLNWMLFLLLIICVYRIGNPFS